MPLMELKLSPGRDKSRLRILRHIYIFLRTHLLVRLASGEFCSREVCDVGIYANRLSRRQSTVFDRNA